MLNYIQISIISYFKVIIYNKKFVKFLLIIKSQTLTITPTNICQNDFKIHNIFDLLEFYRFFLDQKTSQKYVKNHFNRCLLV